ncbi:MAG: hypothetical protein J7K40_02290 [candidate division Zixibacteria bacterium]|nr:hypothetical protein [candidate division Zixibacteria bacterium]
MYLKYLKFAAGLILILIVAASCEKDTPSAPVNYQEGEVRFVNSSTYTLVLEKIIHRRGYQEKQNNLNRTISVGGSIMLPNLFEGGCTFEGGDRITVHYRSSAVNEYGNPIFRNSAYYRVNGESIIRVKGQKGEYEIGGN